MIIKGAKVICDICNRSCFVSAEKQAGEDWHELTLGVLGMVTVRQPSSWTVCSACCHDLLEFMDRLREEAEK